MQKIDTPIIGYGYGNASRNKGAADGPLFIKKFLINKIDTSWQTVLSIKSDLTQEQAINDVTTICKNLAHEVENCLEKHKQFIVIGGDHSSAIGTWNGAAKWLENKPLGLIWIDAHLDSHTSSTSISKNIHGMPAAALLGFGDPKIAKLFKDQPTILPENLKMIGMTDYEKAEIDLLTKLKVEVTNLNQIKSNNAYDLILNHAKKLSTSTDAFGISLDIDAFSPEEAPGVTTFAKHGLDINSTIQALKKITKMPNFIGLEIAEFTPCNDINNKTALLIEKILKNIFIK